MIANLSVFTISGILLFIYFLNDEVNRYLLLSFLRLSLLSLVFHYVHVCTEEIRSAIAKFESGTFRLRFNHATSELSWCHTLLGRTSVTQSSKQERYSCLQIVATAGGTVSNCVILLLHYRQGYILTNLINMGVKLFSTVFIVFFLVDFKSARYHSRFCIFN